MSLDGDYLRSLARILSSEDWTSDLLALLVELDDRPLAEYLQLPRDDQYRAQRETRAKSRDRTDILLYGNSSEPVAILEMKGATDVHNDQLNRYLGWANQFAAAPALYLCAFDNDTLVSDPEWRRIRLQGLFSAWQSSNHPHAAWLASEITKVLNTWDEEADGPVGEATGSYVPTILARRLAQDVTDRLQGDVHATGRSDVYSGDGAGTPIILSRMNHPHWPEEEGITVGVDLRLEKNYWIFRPYVQVSPAEQRNTAQAFVTAQQEAWKLKEFMSHEYVRDILASEDHVEVAQALSTRSHNGFKRKATESNYSKWESHSLGSPKHKSTRLFFHDTRVGRASTMFDLDYTGVTRFEIADAIVCLLSNLYEVLKNSNQQRHIK